MGSNTTWRCSSSSTVYEYEYDPENFSVAEGSHWRQTNIFSDDKDEFKSVFGSNDLTKSFTRKFDKSSESGTRRMLKFSPGLSQTLCKADDDDDVTESQIRAVLDKKALDLKKLHTPLCEEYYSHDSTINTNSRRFSAIVDAQDETFTQSSISDQKRRKWKDELAEELERTREMMRQAGVGGKTSLSNSIRRRDSQRVVLPRK